MYYANRQRCCTEVCASWAIWGKKRPLLNWIFSFRKSFSTENENEYNGWFVQKWYIQIKKSQVQVVFHLLLYFFDWKFYIFEKFLKKRFAFLSGDYFLSQVSLVMASVFASVLVLTIHHKGTQRKPVPPMIKCIAFEGLAKFLFMQNSITTLQRTTFSSRSPSHGGIVLVTNGSAVKGGGPRNLSPRSTCHNSLKISSDDQIRCNRSTVMNNSCSNLDFGSKNESSADTQNSPDHDKVSKPLIFSLIS